MPLPLGGRRATRKRLANLRAVEIRTTRWFTSAEIQESLDDFLVRPSPVLTKLRRRAV